MKPTKTGMLFKLEWVQRSGFLHSLFTCSCLLFFFLSWASSCSCEKIVQWVRVLWQRERTSESYSKGVVRAESSLRRGQSPEHKRRASGFVGFDRSKRLGLECYIQVLAVLAFSTLVLLACAEKPLRPQRSAR